MGEQPADEDLMLSFGKGDAAAFDILYIRYKGPVFRYLLRQCGHKATTEEMFQDVWMNLIAARKRYNVQAKFKTWLFKIAHNRLIDHYRKQSKGVPISFDEEDCPALDAINNEHSEQPDQQVYHIQQATQLNKLIMELPEAQRETFLMREESGLSLQEIAESTGVGHETIKSRLRYAVKTLKQGLQSTFRED